MHAPGVTALEHLGAGYNALEGDPRSSLTTELDPGFRNGVIKLIPDQSKLTLNREFAVPLGAEHRHTASCQLSSKPSEAPAAPRHQSERALNGSNGHSIDQHKLQSLWSQVWKREAFLNE